MRPSKLLTLALLSLSACKHKAPAELDVTTATPRLPSPEAPYYAIVHGQPSDLGVAGILGQRPWEESLSGAAGALALESLKERPITLWRARWAALRSGYPYPLTELLGERVGQGMHAREIERIMAESPAGLDLGLARARGELKDQWVLILGGPPLALQAFPRQLSLGGAFELSFSTEPPPGLSLLYASPSGGLYQAPLKKTFRQPLSDEGEWWFEIRSGAALLAAFAVYVGIDAPKDVPLDDPPPGAPATDDLEMEMLGLIGELRGLFSWPAPTRDPILDATARSRVRMGMSPQDVTIADSQSCQGTLQCRPEQPGGLRSCVRRWYTSATARALLLDPNCSLAGLALGSDNQGVWVDLELGSP